MRSTNHLHLWTMGHWEAAVLSELVHTKIKRMEGGRGEKDKDFGMTGDIIRNFITLRTARSPEKVSEDRGDAGLFKITVKPTKLHGRLKWCHKDTLFPFVVPDQTGDNSEKGSNGRNNAG